MDSTNLKLAVSEEELNQIIELQKKNLKENLSPKEKESQGFVTAEYSLSYLKEVNDLSPAVILKATKVVGYAIAVTREHGQKHALLNELFKQFDRQTYKGKFLAKENYIVVGQLCIDKNHRGKGNVDKMYSFFKTSYPTYRYCVTAVDSENYRSMAVHQRCGFKKIGSLTLSQRPGDVIIWDWEEQAEF
jgi:predicted GNAT superfamily acetyltransferase